MTVQVNIAFKRFFYHQKTIKKKTSSVRNFYQLPITVCRGASIPYFEINAPFFGYPLFIEKYLKPQVRIKKIVSLCSVDYQFNPSGLASRIDPQETLLNFL